MFCAKQFKENDNLSCCIYKTKINGNFQNCINLLMNLLTTHFYTETKTSNLLKIQVQTLLMHCSVNNSQTKITLKLNNILKLHQLTNRGTHSYS